jgi:CBS domain-containing protein
MTQRATSHRPVDPATPVRDVMHRDPCVLDATARVVDAARAMQTRDIGDVLVRSENGTLGILTDRDIVVRVVAGDRDTTATTAGEVCTRTVATLAPHDTVARAVELMRERAVRRLPVVEDGMPAGIVTLGDLAIERQPDSVLGDISAASPNL